MYSEPKIGDVFEYVSKSSGGITIVIAKEIRFCYINSKKALYLISTNNIRYYMNELIERKDLTRENKINKLL